MSNTSEISIKRVCCTCLSRDRRLLQLCKINDGINLLYMLLTHDPEAYKEGFYKDTASLYVCWECLAVIQRIKKFQTQACAVQKQLTIIADGRNDAQLQSYTRLSNIHNTTFQYEFKSDDITENFIDCGIDIKLEDPEPYDDIDFQDEPSNEPENVKNEPLDSHIGNEPTKIGYDDTITGNYPTIIGNDYRITGNATTKFGNDNTITGNDPTKIGNYLVKIVKGSSSLSIELGTIEHIPTKNELMETNKTSECYEKSLEKYKKYFTLKTMNQEEMRKAIEKRRLELICSNVTLKCEPCSVGFKTSNELVHHNAECHRKKEDHTQCDICLMYIIDLPTHRRTHYEYYTCNLCTHTEYTHKDMVGHVNSNHGENSSVNKKESKRRGRKHRSAAGTQFPCHECDEVFETAKTRWRHAQIKHRDGYKCVTCAKRFAFKSNLEKHERLHQGPLPREECATCRKSIRTDLMRAHLLTHSETQAHSCVECNKTFKNRMTYENHMKYTQPHATVDICKHKCALCPKEYRSRGELRDHVDYRHRGEAKYTCPICGKGLAKKKSVRIHIRETHEGIKDRKKDKICQQCGRAFSSNKNLLEHELRHTGARPLACAQCGRTFRQKAALYTHMRRLHKPPETAA